MKSRGVENGTAVGQRSLCYTCTYSQVRRGFAESEEAIYCTYRRWQNPELVQHAVRECSAYDHKSHASLCHMEKVAWILMTKGAGRTVGFVTPKKFKEIEGEDAEVLP